MDLLINRQSNCDLLTNKQDRQTHTETKIQSDRKRQLSCTIPRGEVNQDHIFKYKK